MGYLHKNGIIHRDVKPENIMFAQNVQANVETKDMQQAYNVKLIDLGMSAYFDSDIPTKGADPLTHLFSYIKDTHIALPAQPLACYSVMQVYMLHQILHFCRWLIG